MDFSDVGRLFDDMEDFFPNYRKKDSVELYKLWVLAFKDNSYEQVKSALVAYAMKENNGFAPSLGQLRNLMMNAQANENDNNGELEAWNLVSKALRNGLYGYREEFAKLPPLVQETLGDATILREWAGIDVDQVQTVIASNFQRSYRAKAASIAEREKIPDSIRSRIMGATNAQGGGLQSIGSTMQAIALAPKALPIINPEPKALPDPNALPSSDAIKAYMREMGYNTHLFGTIEKAIEATHPADWKSMVDELTAAEDGRMNHNPDRWQQEVAARRQAIREAESKGRTLSTQEWMEQNADEVEKVRQLLGFIPGQQETA